MAKFNWYRFIAYWVAQFKEEPVHGLASFLRTLLESISWLRRQDYDIDGVVSEVLDVLTEVSSKIMPEEESFLESEGWLLFLAWVHEDLRLEEKKADEEGAGATWAEFLESCARRLSYLTTDKVIGSCELSTGAGLSLPTGTKFRLAAYLAPWFQVMLYTAALSGEHVGIAGTAADFQAMERARYWADKDTGGTGQPSYPPGWKT